MRAYRGSERARLVVLAVAAMAVAAAALQKTDALAELRREFVNPPDDCRIMMRWWWFGPAVSHAELERELRVMRRAGIGGVEIQPVYPLELDDPKKGFHNQRYLSDEFLDAVRFASQMARQLGMRVDITLGSGWPYGGPDTPITEAAGRLRIERVPIKEGSRSAAVPPMENGESLIAAFPESGDAKQLFFIASRTGQQVKRAALGAEGFVLDHYDRTAVEHHLAAVGDPLMKAFESNPPYAVFSDSLEVYGSDWTSDFLREFRQRRGYDLTPYLPALVSDFDDAASIRHDWGKTLTELAEEHYLTPIRAWAHAHHTLFRSQTYGEPPVRLSSGADVDLAEGEAGPRWRMFNTARWAASANHLYGRNVTSTETWTWLHAPSFRATPLDMKAEADLHFVEGINQLIGHGWPYSPPEAGEPGWRFYAAASFNDHNPWFQVMPEIARYLQRISFLMRQGKPVTDVAIYLPTDDAWAGFRPGRTSIDRSVEALLGPTLIPQILSAGYNFDYIDDRAIEKVGVPYRVLIVPGVERMPIETLRHVEEFAGKGGSVIVTRRLPSRAPGFMAEAETKQVVSLANNLFGGAGKNSRFLPDEQMLGQTLRTILQPDLQVDDAVAPVMAFAHRKLAEGDVYFVVNTSNATIETDVKFRATGEAESWDAFSGKTGEKSGTKLRLAPYESRVIVVSEAQIREAADRSGPTGAQVIDLSANWKVTFNRLHKTAEMARLHSWTDDDSTRFYSGEVVYEKSIEVPTDLLRAGRIMLDFGEGEKVAPLSGRMPGNALGMRALLESPIRESAIVYVNGQLAGSVWHPPYQVDVTRLMHRDRNELRIVVANLAINEMAGKALPNYRLLNLRYGERFVPQGFENLQALPAGMLGPVHLVAQ